MEETRIVKGSSWTIGALLTQDALSIEPVYGRLSAAGLIAICNAVEFSSLSESGFIPQYLGFKVRTGMSGCRSFSFFIETKLPNVWKKVLSIHVSMSEYIDGLIRIPIEYVKFVQKVLSMFYDEEEITIVMPKENFIDGIVWIDDVVEDKERGGDEIEIPVFDDEEEI